jgi:undecaprenol kinase
MRRFLKSFGYSFEGVAHAFKFEPNFRFHLAALIVVGFMGWYLRLSSSEWLWIAAVSAIVIMAELFNTAIEVLVDLVSPEIHPKAKIVKDLASAAVLVAAILAATIGLIIFIPKI